MKQYVVDAFTDHVFSGNPAAVCIMDGWISDELMLAVAKENNLSETAFAVKEEEGYRLRWFTPGGEIDLCGHATLAAASVIMNHYEPDLLEIRFRTMGGILAVKKTEEKAGDMLYEMDFPAYSLKPAEITSEIAEAVGAEPVEVYAGRDLLCVFSDEEMVRNLKPDPERMKRLEGLLLHATAKGREYDCVSRSCSEARGNRRSRLRLRTLPHHTVLGGKVGKRPVYRLSGVGARRNAVLPHGRRPCEAGRKGGPLFRGGDPVKAGILREKMRERNGYDD